MSVYDLEKQHKKGKLHAIERLDMLLDKGSFLEIYSGVKHNCTNFGFLDKEIPYDGVITGFGTVNGKTVAVYAQDFTVQGGTLGYMHGQKIARLYEKAIDIKCPVIGINDSGGARIQEGVNALAGYGDVFMQNVKASGYIPQISIIAGPCAGGAVYSPGITDFIFIVDNIGFMFITGSKVVKAALGIDINDAELGGSLVHSEKSGVVHFRMDNEKVCYETVRKLLSYIPHYRGEARDKKQFNFSKLKKDAIVKILPERSKQGYDIRLIIDSICDDDSFFELHRDFAKNIVTGFMYIEGYLIGVVANQPLYIGGIADSDASVKAARFIRYCDAFDIPLLTLVDIPGFMPGPDEERKGIIRHGAKLIYAYAEAVVPKVTLIVRKAYGGAYIAMCSTHIGADFVFAWEQAEIAVMGAEGAVRILYSKDILNADMNDVKKIEDDYQDKYMNPDAAAEYAYITEIICPENTREKIAQAFRVLKNKKIENVCDKKHGNIPL